MITIHVIVISSVRPEQTSGGQIILHRQLVDRSGITLEIYGAEPKRWTVATFMRRMAGQMGRHGLHRYIEGLWVIWGARWIDHELPKSIKNSGNTIVLTVAHGDVFMAASRFAAKNNLPLLACFQDWWPDVAQVHRPIQKLLERKFRKLYKDADISLCVCEGMRNALGENPKAYVLHDAPAKRAFTGRKDSCSQRPYTVLYFGNLVDYGPMLGEALERSLSHPEIFLQVRGTNPAWSEDRKSKMRSIGNWLDFAPRGELDTWLASADAFLIPMVFTPSHRRRMATSFPSKLIEFAQFGKPLVIWGPTYCSAVHWARNGNKALCVTDPAPEAVVQNLLDLRSNREASAYYGTMASKSASEEFDQSAIQSRFIEYLGSLVSGKGVRDP